MRRAARRSPLAGDGVANRKPILSTLRYWGYPQWTGRVDILDRGHFSKLAFLRRLVAASRSYSTVVLTGTTHWDQIAAILIGHLPNSPRLVMTDATWTRGTSGLDRLINWLGMRAMDGPHITYCVLSSHERATFPKTWGVDHARVRFTPFCYTMTENDLELPTRDDGGVFAGGESFRDYDPLIRAARSIDVPVVIAASPPEGWPRLPPNLRIGRITHRAFLESMRFATVVVVPLQSDTDRSAGQQTYLNAMALGKPVVATDSPGVRDYVEEGVTGLVVPPGDEQAMERALRWVLAPEHREDVDRIRTRARDVVRLRFSRERYIECILRVVDEGGH